LGGLECPLLSDKTKALSSAYGVLDEKAGVALRATFIINPAGVMFAPGAQVDVGGLVATTMPISYADAVSGRYVFTNNGNSGEVVNQGRITALNGYVGLFAPKVINEGIIVARMGQVVLAAGNQVTLDMVGDGLIKVSVDQAALNASAMNRGTIEADGGNVLLTARSANALLDTVVNTDGIIRANTISNRNGTITLDGGDKGIVSVSGTWTPASDWSNVRLTSASRSRPRSGRGRPRPRSPPPPALPNRFERMSPKLDGSKPWPPAPPPKPPGPPAPPKRRPESYCLRLSASLPATFAGSFTPQCAVTGWPGQKGQVSPAAWSHTVSTKSIAGAPGRANSSQLLERSPAVSSPWLASSSSAKRFTAPCGWLPALYAMKRPLPAAFR